MHRPYHIQIDIPSPCHEDWNKMTPCEQGRHCAHCDKVVTDFTTWSDTALYEFFAKDQGNACGRFHTSQLGRPIHIPPQPDSRLYRMVVAMGLILLFAQGTGVYAQSKAPLTHQKAGKASMPKDRIGKEGKVEEKKGKPYEGSKPRKRPIPVQSIPAVTTGLYSPQPGTWHAAMPDSSNTSHK